MTVDQLGIHLGPLYVRFYGIILVTGAFLATYLASLEARRRGQNPDHAWDGVIWALIGGIIGARLWHIFTPPVDMVVRGIDTRFYLTHPLDALAIWNGGLGIPGGVAGGVLGLLIYTRRRKLSLVLWLDIAVPGLALAQSIGRWGNYVNQELYGLPTTLPWGIHIDYPLPEYAGFDKFHPLFLYESIWNLAVCLALLWLARRLADWLKPGDLFTIYLVLYPTARFLLEFIRLETSEVAGVNVNQVLMLVVAVASAAALFFRHRRATTRAAPRAT